MEQETSTERVGEVDGSDEHELQRGGQKETSVQREVDEAIEAVCDGTHVHRREDGLRRLSVMLREEGSHGAAEAALSAALCSSHLASQLQPLLASSKWEERHGAFLLSALLLPHLPATSALACQTFILEAVRQRQQDEEGRVRLAAADCCLPLAFSAQPQLLTELYSSILSTIEASLAALPSLAPNHSSPPSSSSPSSSPLITPATPSPSLSPPSPPSSPKGHSASSEPSSARFLETSLRCLQRAMEGELAAARGDSSQPPCPPAVTETPRRAALPEAPERWREGSSVERVLRDISESEQRGNRFVREAALFALASLVPLCLPWHTASLATQVVAIISRGLADEWSQVRLAACVAARSFLAAVSNSPQQFYANLLPQICLNRYYAADGLRKFSQDTWQQVVGMGGRAVVAAHISAFVAYYRSQLKSRSYLIREAALYCIGELIAKIEPLAVSPHLLPVYELAVVRHEDQMWPVRTAACAVSMRMLEHYSTALLPAIDRPFTLWTANLSDHVNSIRQDAAHLLGLVAKHLPQLAPQVVDVTKRLLLRMREEGEEEATKAAAAAATSAAAAASGGVMDVTMQRGISAIRIEAAPGRRSLQHAARGSGCEAADDKGHHEGSSCTNRDHSHAHHHHQHCTPSSTQAANPPGFLISRVQLGGSAMPACPCGAPHSLPLHHASGAQGGAGAEGSVWEACEGAVYVVKELSANFPQSAEELMPLLAEIMSFSYTTPMLMDTILHELPIVASNLGRRRFKSYLEMFLAPIFRALDSNLQSSAGKCIARLQMLVGPPIFVGRLSEEQRQLMESKRHFLVEGALVSNMTLNRQ